MTPWGVIKTIIFGGSTLVFFFILWFYNPFKHVEHYEVDEEVKEIIENPWKKVDEKSGKTIADEGRELFIQRCAGCHSLRYDGIYVAPVQADPRWKKVEQAAGRPVYRFGVLYKDRFFVPRDVYEAFAHEVLESFKSSFGQVPPDLSTIYLARGEGYLYRFILNPNEILPGTSMPPVFAGPSAKEETAKVVAYLKSVNTPPPQEQTKRAIMGVAVILYFVIFGALFWRYREVVLRRLGYH
ncbi:MAG: cytochrome c1 [Aquificae bacterium]|nr:cytochrome c1 [Aquificota bacterium]